MAIDYDNPDNLLDMGNSLKKEKTFKENQEKIAKLKEEYKKEQNKEESVPFSILKYKSILFLLCIILVAVGIRLYVASMPLTEQWAEQIVEANIKDQVSNKITEQYPTLSDVAKGDLIIKGTQEALIAEQNQQTIENFKHAYQESYRDSEGTAYLYEIDPYYFYGVAQNPEALFDLSTRSFLPFFERWFYSCSTLLIPNISFTKSISYIPLLFTLLSAACIFFIGKIIWNEEAGFIAALLFVSHPILLEFSLIGFVDTNMLNIFFILVTGLLFIVSLQSFKNRKYVILGISAISIIPLIILFRYNWSAWYISIILLIIPLCCYGLLLLCKKIYYWNQQTKKTKYAIFSVCIILLICGGIFISFINTTGINKYIPNNVKTYLHIESKSTLEVWPNAFSLITELQSNSFSEFIGYLGKLFFIFAFCTFIYLLYLTIKEGTILYLYILISFLVFTILAVQAIRLLPYVIPFFALLFGIGFISTVNWITTNLKRLFFPNEKKSILLTTYIILFIIISLPFVYPLVNQITEKSNIMPIMDDAIYNSAIYLKENSPENAVVSTWWDRGTFYNTLAEREVHLQSAPHMPWTYWLSLFYITDSSVEAKNIMRMLTCHQGYNIPNYVMSNLSKSDSMIFMSDLLSLSTFEQQTEFINASFVNEYINDNFISSLSACYNNSQETYVVVIDDIMPRFSSVQYLAQWDFETEQEDLKYPYTNLDEGGCSRTQSGVYCTVNNANFYVNLTNLDWKSQLLVDEVFVVENNTVQHNVVENQTIQKTLIVYQRADQWKVLYLSKEVADSIYIRLMVLDAYNAPEFEKVFDEVHTETSWVKVYKVKVY
ncbi:MAG: STT3 domain-containing protein [Candidatus Woesearchaeota archaeon]|jgi:dolichyl-diphosphooligosaccharide--protein glycosyltransferase